MKMSSHKWWHFFISEIGLDFKFWIIIRLLASGISSDGQSAWFGTKRSRVRVPHPRNLYVFPQGCLEIKRFLVVEDQLSLARFLLAISWHCVQEGQRNQIFFGFQIVIYKISCIQQGDSYKFKYVFLTINFNEYGNKTTR